MRLPCLLCGERDRREFTFHGAALPRPEGEAWSDAWHAYIHLRDNPAGASREYWCHDPCGTFAVLTRDTLTHAVLGVTEPPDSRSKFVDEKGDLREIPAPREGEA